jgi:hypothetical protein
MDAKEAEATQSHHETRDSDNAASPINMPVPPEGNPNPPQEATRFMIFFSLWIALAGWIFNFDLGKRPSQHLHN